MIRKAIGWILEALYPTRAKCLGCGDDQGCDEPFLCSECRRLLKPVNIVARKDSWKARGLESAAFVYYYEKPVKGLIRAFKFQSVKMLADSMAQEMDELIEARELDGFDAVIPVPLHPSRKSQRGFNQAELLARPIAERYGAQMRTDILKRTRRTKQQARLRIEERGANLSSAFTASRNAAGMSVLLVDDVVTTGSTLCACAEALKEAGAREIHAIALAGSRSWKRGNVRKYRLKKK